MIGPGLLVAAAGIGAGDIVSATVAGAANGLVLLWVIFLAAFLKCVLNEGIGRYQLATGRTVLEGWAADVGEDLFRNIPVVVDRICQQRSYECVRPGHRKSHWWKHSAKLGGQIGMGRSGNGLAVATISRSSSLKRTR
jgi:hypothetical protein